MMRLLFIAALAAGCSNDVCTDIDGTCEALTIEGSGTIDGLSFQLSGAASGHKVVPEVATPHALPVEVALALSSAEDGDLHIDISGVYLGEIVGRASLDLSIRGGAHGSAHVQLSP